MKLKPKYFEDFEVGLIFESEPSLISKNEIKDEEYEELYKLLSFPLLHKK